MKKLIICSCVSASLLLFSASSISSTEAGAVTNNPLINVNPTESYNGKPLVGTNLAYVHHHHRWHRGYHHKCGRYHKCHRRYYRHG